MRPMLATPAAIPAGPEWTFEVKWDGMRVLALVPGDGTIRLMSRNEKDVTASFPELTGLADLGRTALFDGEVVALDSAGLPSFERLGERMHVTSARRAAALADESPVTYVIFDLLRLDGESLVDRSFRERRALLAGLTLPPGPWTISQTFVDGAALHDQTLARGLEGIVAKRWDSRYRPGVRSPDWVKHSNRTTTDAVVVGWRGSNGAVASLALATVTPDGTLTYAGTAGSGIGAAMGRRIRAGVGDLVLEQPAVAITDPDEVARLTAQGFTWVAPHLVVEIQHLGRSGSQRFRQPVVARIRTDLEPHELGWRAPTQTARTTAAPVRALVAGRRIKLENLAKVLYPATGTTKAEVVEYYATVAPRLLTWAADRCVTRRRWPDGVAAGSFFEKNLPTWAPEWIRRVQIPTSDGSITYPVLGPDDIAAVVWFAAHAALELHTPQWRVDAAGRPLPPDRLVIDLDPGPPAGLAECAAVALLVRERLAGVGLECEAVLSGRKGLHLYAPLPDDSRDGAAVTALARDLAQSLQAEHPRLVVAAMTKAVRPGRVFLDWSQNRTAKTTLTPWSLRGHAEPTVALPVEWAEVDSGDLRQVRFDEALARLG